MFVYLPRWSRYGLFAACTLASAACDKPDLYSDLRPDGPPEVLTVSVNAPDNRDGFEAVSLGDLVAALVVRQKGELLYEGYQAGAFAKALASTS